MKFTKKFKIVSFLCLLSFIVAVGSIQYNHTRSIAVAKFYSFGSTGDTVRSIQDKLKRWGYYTGTVDGKYGYKTWEAVRHFQKSNNIKVDGIAGESTLRALGIFEKSKTASSAQRQNDVMTLAKIINGEGRGEPYLGQVAIGAVIMNRVRHASFPNSVAAVIYQPGAFDAVSDGQINLTPSDASIKAAQDALNGWDPVDGAIYYWNPKTATSKWILSIPIIKKIGNHVFGKK